MVGSFALIRTRSVQHAPSSATQDFLQLETERLFAHPTKQAFTGSKPPHVAFVSNLFYIVSADYS